MAFPNAFIDELINKNDIEDVVSQYVRLTRKGGNLFGLCPFHGEKTASFSVSQDKQIFYCFGCGKGGGVITFIMEIESLDFPDAIRFLAKRAGLAVPEDGGFESSYKIKEEICDINKKAARFYYETLQSQKGSAARAYIEKRGLSRGTVTRFGIGASPDGWDSLITAMKAEGVSPQQLVAAGLAIKNAESGSIYDRFRNRLMFPIIDLRGSVIGFGGRVLDDSQPKYLNSPETAAFNKSKNLFALNIAKKSKQGRIILTEGYMDAISLHQAGFDNAVASLGTSLTAEHAKLLGKYANEAVIAYDGDEAGQNAAKRAIGVLSKESISIKIIRMEGAKDPDEYIRKFGQESFKRLVERSGNHIEFRLSSIQSKFNLTADEDKVSFLKEAVELIAGLNTAVEREVYGTRVAEAAGVAYDTVKIEVDRALKKKLSSQKKKQEHLDLSPAVTVQPKISSVKFQNVKSARAEQGLIKALVTDPALWPKCDMLSPERFSVPLYGRVYGLLRERQGSGAPAAALEGVLTAEEMTHITALLSNTDNTLNLEKALSDYIETIETEASLNAAAEKQEDLRHIAEKYKEKKGYGGQKYERKH